jgi:flagella basal body P-ring formation protein FlgA
MIAVLCHILLLLQPGDDCGVRVREAVEGFVRERLPGVTVLVEFRSMPDLQSGDSTSVRIPLDMPLGMKGNISIPIELVSRGNVEARGIVSVKVRTFERVLVAARAILKGESPSAAEVIQQTVETTMLTSDLIVHMEELQNMRACRIVGAGNLLHRNAFEAVPIVHANDRLLLRVKAGKILLSTTCTARQDGRKGEQIDVRGAGMSGTVRATVVDAKTVEFTLD